MPISVWRFGTRTILFLEQETRRLNTDWDDIYRKKVVEGDKEAFRYFIKMYQEMAISIAISMIKNRVDALDVVQNSFVLAFKGIKNFKGDSKFSSWLYKIVLNESLKHIRKNKNRNQTVSLRDDLEDYGVSFYSATKEIELKEQREKIKKVLKAMKPKEALVLNLHYLHERKIKEIIEITGYKESNIKVLLFRARKSFMGLFLKLKEQEE